jgi:hypothetical protein
MLPEGHQPEENVNEFVIVVFQQVPEQVWVGHHWVGFERCMANFDIKSERYNQSSESDA